MAPRIPIVALLVVLFMFGGCYESPTEVTLYEPGKYKGQDDPLLQQIAEDPEHHERLNRRLQQGQVDR
jgi:hypothetical protein